MIYVSDPRAIELDNYGWSNNPFVAWDNVAKGKTFGGTSTLTDGAAANAFTGTTYDYWLPNVTTSTAVLTVDLGSAMSVGTAGIAADNCTDYGATLTVEHSPDNAAWTDCGCGTVTPDDGPTVLRFSAISRRYWRLTFGGLTSGDDLAVGVAFLGPEVVFTRRLYQGFSPVITQTEVQLQSNVSVGGNLLGSTVIATGSTLAAQVNNLDPAFIRGDGFSGFMRSFSRGSPFFFGWRPAKYPQDVHYCWRDGDVIRPTNSGPRDLMSFEMQCRVYDG